MALNPGDVVDQKYRIVRLLGEGGMGAVYEGENSRIHRRVAIKVLHAAVASSADAVQRFEREAQAAGRIGSEHIVEVLDLGHLADGDRYMVMEFLDGQALSERIQLRGRLSPQVIAPIVMQLLEGLRAAHEAGIIHRDLKPDNVYLLAGRSGQKDFVKILDFGISKFNALGTEFSMTRTGAVMGTPYYMSPEQAKGTRNVDLRADLYAVGVILYEALAGEVPFNADSFNELLFKIVLESPTPLTERVPGLDAEFAALVEKAMARDPAARFQTAEELQQALRHWLANAPAHAESTLTQDAPPGDSVASDSASQGASDPAGAPVNRTPSLRTQESWAQSGEYGSTRKGVPRSALFAAVAVAVLALGAGGLYVARASGEAEEQARIAAQQAEEAKAAAAREAEELRLEAEKARAEAERAHAERQRLEEEAGKSVVEQQRLEAERAAAEKLARQKEEAARVAARRRAAAVVAAPPPSSTSTSSSGRVIRTDL